MTESTVDTRMRDFRLLMIGRTLSLVGASMTGLAMMLLALDLSGSAIVAGVWRRRSHWVRC